MTMILRPRWRLAESSADRLSAPYTAPPIPVLEIAEQNGVDVVIADFGENSAKVAGFCDFKNAKIYVNVGDRVDRQSFTIAHELGHWMLHKDIFINEPDRYPVLPRFSSPNREDPLEKEANKFAACLLVPERLLRPVKDVPISELARIFGVSRTMMEFRIKNI